MNKKLNSKNSADNNYSFPKNGMNSIQNQNLQDKENRENAPRMSELDLRNPDYKCFHFYPETPKNN